MTAIILHCYGLTRPTDQEPTWDYLDTIRDRYGVRDVRCKLPTDYADAWRRVWSETKTLVNIEHDMEPDPGMLEGLLACPEPLCGQAYWLPSLSTGRTTALCCAFHDDFRPLRYGESRARAMGLGLVKLTVEGRKALGMPELVKWNQLDYEILTHVRKAGLLWHVHWPACIHHHGFMEGENDRIREYRRYRAAARAGADSSVDGRAIGEGAQGGGGSAEVGRDEPERPLLNPGRDQESLRPLRR